MPAPLPDTKRRQILDAIKTGDQSRNAIARQHGVSVGTVTNIAKQAGLHAAFDRSKTRNATRAKAFDARAARAQLLVDLYGDAQRFRERSWSPYTQVVGGPQGPELVTTKLPPLRDQQSGYTAMAICVDKALRIEQADADAQTGQIGSLLGSLFDDLAARYGETGSG